MQTREGRGRRIALEKEFEMQPGQEGVRAGYNATSYIISWKLKPGVRMYSIVSILMPVLINKRKLDALLVVILVELNC